MTNECQNHFQAVRKTRASREIVAQIRDMIPDAYQSWDSSPIFMDCGRVRDEMLERR